MDYTVLTLCKQHLFEMTHGHYDENQLLILRYLKPINCLGPEKMDRATWSFYNWPQPDAFGPSVVCSWQLFHHLHCWMWLAVVRAAVPKVKLPKKEFSGQVRGHLGLLDKCVFLLSYAGADLRGIFTVWETLWNEKVLEISNKPTIHQTSKNIFKNLKQRLRNWCYLT